MDELCLQRIVRTGHRMALEGYDRGSRSGCRMPLPTSTEAGGCHRCLLPRAVPVGYHRYTTTRSAAASVHGYQHSLAWEENVNHGQLESREEKPSPGALPEEFVADVIGSWKRRRWPTLAGRRWRNSGLAGRTSHHSLGELKLGELLDTPPPGLDEAIAISKVMQFLEAPEYSMFSRIVFDTAPTVMAISL
ncbi:hypothetical protein ZWY2020_058461 [Hordeum vulgare]|nr:hypothetical protein ZWY2020_058461 [Hordeum vulgare]